MKPLDIIRTLHRCMYIQATWNYKGLLNLGFAQAMIPTVCRLFRDPRERSACIRRHMNFFLSNPYFATYAVGACIRLEEEAARTGRPDPEQIEAFKRGIGSPLASLGDNFIWGALRPSFLLIGSALALNGNLWGPLLFLLGYNLPAITIRSIGLIRGYRLGLGVVREITSPWFQRVTQWLRLLSAAGLGFMGAVVVDTLLDGGGGSGVWAPAVIGVVLLGRLFKVSYYIVLSVCLTVFLILGYL